MSWKDILIAVQKGIVAKGTHTHKKSEITDFSHTQAASTVTAGTLGGKVVANATAVTTLSDKQIRNIYAGTSELTAGVSALPTGDIYIQYE